jgi:hypothetical protein
MLLFLVLLSGKLDCTPGQLVSFHAQDLDLENDASSRQAYAKQISDYFAWVKQLQQKRCASLCQMFGTHVQHLQAVRAVTILTHT